MHFHCPLFFGKIQLLLGSFILETELVWWRFCVYVEGSFLYTLHTANNKQTHGYIHHVYRCCYTSSGTSSASDYSNDSSCKNRSRRTTIPVLVMFVFIFTSLKESINSMRESEEKAGILVEAKCFEHFHLSLRSNFKTHELSFASHSFVSIK